MPTLTATAKDATLSSLSSNFSTARDSTTATLGLNVTQASNEDGVRCDRISARGGFLFTISRAFFEFDTSGISATPSAATFKLYGNVGTSADLFAVKHTIGDLATPSGGDYDAIDGWSAGADNSSNVTKYSSEVSSWSDGQYNEITLNSTALSDMASNDYLKICLIEADFDLPNNTPSDNTVRRTGFFMVESSGTSKDPIIDYTVASAGYGHDVVGVAAANIGKIKGVATANVGKVIGVD